MLVQELYNILTCIAWPQPLLDAFPASTRSRRSLARNNMGTLLPNFPLHRYPPIRELPLQLKPMHSHYPSGLIYAERALWMSLLAKMLSWNQVLLSSTCWCSNSFGATVQVEEPGPGSNGNVFAGMCCKKQSSRPRC